MITIIKKVYIVLYKIEAGLLTVLVIVLDLIIKIYKEIKYSVKETFKRVQNFFSKLFKMEEFLNLINSDFSFKPLLIKNSEISKNFKPQAPPTFNHF